MTSPSERLYGKPPTNIHALDLYSSCHELLGRLRSSCSLSFFTFLIFLKESD